ncbi:hypothetical protein NO938_005389, partial [Citrobacter freundii]|uniref:hypothetical protein n=1 Tax=Citrobacter freundii TaxID=546 RepID=UPI003ED8856E
RGKNRHIKVVIFHHLSKGSEMHSEIEKMLNDKTNDSPEARAELVRALVKKVYDFVKFERPEGEGLDGRDGYERQSLAKILDAVEDHCYRISSINTK